MPHFAFVCPPLLGHVSPMLSVAERLRERGHRCSFLAFEDVRPWIPPAVADFHEVGEASHPAGRIRAMWERMGRLNGPIGLRGLLEDLADITEALCRDLPGRLEALDVDAVIVDQLEPAGALAAEAAGRPSLTLASALPINREPDVPPPYVGWSYRPDAFGRRRNAGVLAVVDRMMRRQGDILEAAARRHGLRPRRRADEFLSPLADVSQLVREIDFPRRHLPPSFRYVGPIRPRDDGASVELPLRPGERYAYCSLGSLQGGRAGLFRRIAAACADAGLRPVITHVGRLSPAEVAAMPGDALVHDFLPQRRVLAGAALAVVHGGLNTVLDALAHGVPLVVVPLAFEQPAIAARLVRLGVARRVDPLFATRSRLRRAIAAMAGGDRAREAAGAIGRALAGTDGAGAVADLAEGLVRRSASAGANGAARRLRAG